MGRPKKTAALTDRQLQVCKLVCDGLQNKEIAEKLGISKETVEVHRYNAYKALGVNNTVLLMRKLLKVYE